MNHVTLTFNNTFSGEMSSQNGQLNIGQTENSFLPYELLAGALGSCLYATFLDVIKKMRLDFEACSLDIVWEKREEVPTTMKMAHVKAVITGADQEKASKYEHAFKLSTDYCSVYHTLSQVAELTWDLSFA